MSGGGSNVYGLDFLRREHTLQDDGTPKDHYPGPTAAVTRTSSLNWADLEAMAASVAHKSDLEKQFDVIHFLQAHRAAGCLAPSVIYQRTGIDLHENEAVALNLQNNPKIRVEHVPDPENPSLMIATYAYQSKYNHVRDRTTLLAQINRCKNGVARRDLEDAYDGAERDLDALICAGDILAITNTEDKDKILFPRGEPFLVELDGIIVVPKRQQKKTQQQPTQTSKGSGSNNNKKNSTSSNNANGNSRSSSPNPSNKESKSDADNGDSSNDASKITKTQSKDENDDAMDTKSDDDTAKSDTKSKDVEESTKSSESPSKPEISKPKKSTPTYTVETDIDPRRQIRRGEAIQIGGQWFRVSSAVREGVPLKDQPARAQAPLSVVSLADLSKRNEQDGYIRPLSERLLPLDAALSEKAIENLRKAKEARDLLHKYAHGGRSGGVVSQMFSSHAHSSNPTTLAASLGSTAAASANSRKRPNKQINTGSSGSGGGVGGGGIHKNKLDAIQKAQEAAMDPALSLYTHARRHGCTKDVRSMYLATRKHVPEMDSELHNLLLEHKLLEPGELMRRPRLKKKANVDNDGKPKKRRYYERKNQRMTNTHLEGTEIGAVLRRATEKQKQGESVGDGGM